METGRDEKLLTFFLGLTSNLIFVSTCIDFMNLSLYNCLLVYNKIISEKLCFNSRSYK